MRRNRDRSVTSRPPTYTYTYPATPGSGTFDPHLRSHGARLHTPTTRELADAFAALDAFSLRQDAVTTPSRRTLSDRALRFMDAADARVDDLLDPPYVPMRPRTRVLLVAFYVALVVALAVVAGVSP